MMSVLRLTVWESGSCVKKRKVAEETECIHLEEIKVNQQEASRVAGGKDGEWTAYGKESPSRRWR